VSVARLRTVPAVLAMLVLGAHYFRGASYLATAACLLAPVLFFLRRPWSVVVSRVVLLAACVVWIVTALRLAEARRAFGEPYLRMVLILAGVAAFTAAAALLLPDAERRGEVAPPGGLP
jgi:VIT1/CCC1 family predicted Fe2+/Mn2+ transporter